MQDDSRRKVDGVLFFGAACAEHHAGIADAFHIVGDKISGGFCAQIPGIFCLAEALRVPEDGSISPLCLKHFAAQRKSRSVINDRLGHCAAPGQIPFPGQIQHIGGKLQADLRQIGGAFAPEHRHTLGHLQRIANAVAQRGIHIRDERRHLAAVSRPNGNHQTGQLNGILQILHERTAAHRHIQQDRVRSCGKLFAHDGGSDQWDAAHRCRHIPQSVHFFISHRNFSALADHRNADLVDLAEKFLLRQRSAGAGYRFHLVNGAAGMPQAPPAHFGDLDAAGRHDGSNDKRGFVPHAAGGMFIRLDAGNSGKIHHVAGMSHHLGQLGGFLIGHTAQIDGHKQG